MCVCEPFDCIKKLQFDLGFRARRQPVFYLFVEGCSVSKRHGILKYCRRSGLHARCYGAVCVLFNV